MIFVVRFMHQGKCVHAFRVAARDAVEALERARLANVVEAVDAEEISVMQDDPSEEPT